MWRWSQWHSLKIDEKLPSIGGNSKNKKFTPLPYILHWGVCCFLQVAGTVAQHSKEGVGDGELYFALFTLAKRQRGPLRQSLSTNVVADFCCTVVWAKFIYICYLLLGETCLERRVQESSDLLLAYPARYLSFCFFLYLKVKLVFSRHQEWIFRPFHCQSKDGYQLLSHLHKFVWSEQSTAHNQNKI